MAETKKQQVARLVAQAVGAGRPVQVETVDFSDPHRPKTCLEVDFPILPVNQVAVIEGNAGKPIYQMSKWWARRRSSVFRATLLAAAMKAPEDPTEAARQVWDVYYANHQAKGALSHLRVADIFGGGGTTLVEGSRLGMQMLGSELNPVAWFVIRNEFAQVDPEEVQALLDDVEAEVRPQIMPYYACDCPRGHRGRWTDLRTKRVMPEGFRAWEVPPEERRHYRYEGPEIIYVFWAKHGPCQVTGCGHRTPLMSSPVMAVKTLSVKAWTVPCRFCGLAFDVEEADARMAPGVPLALSPEEPLFAVRDTAGSVTCPHCAETFRPPLTGKGKTKKVDLSLLVHPDWLAGAPSHLPDGTRLGGSATDSAEDTAAWLRERARTLRLLEVRGRLPEEVECPETGVVFSTSAGTIPKQSTFECAACGKAQTVVTAMKASQRTGPMAPYALQGHCHRCEQDGQPYGGRFFADHGIPGQAAAAGLEWEQRRSADLSDWWPRSEIPYSHETHVRRPMPNHGFTHWWKMFNPTQLLVHSQMLRALLERGRHDWSTREFALGAFQQYLRNQNLFCFWDISRDCLAPHMSNNNYHPKMNVVENCVFADLGRGNWRSCCEGLPEGLAWTQEPWELLSTQGLRSRNPALAASTTGKSEKVPCGDPVRPLARLDCASSTDLAGIASGSLDLVVTDPPFEGLLQYAELSDFFYVWLRLALKDRYPEQFGPEFTPKTLEAVANPARHGDEGSAFYQRILTACWREAHRTLKAGGLLAFTFHHSEDEPWVRVLESLFDAGFYLEAIYPIRSDETKGEGEFGSQKVEYDMLHVCRKRLEEPRPVSWARMRRAVLEDLRGLKSVLESHAKSGLPAADMQVIRRGKALEYYSRHYGQVWVDEDTVLSVRDAILGINQLLDEEDSPLQDPPPLAAEPLTRQFLRIFASASSVPRDQVQKFLRGTGIPPALFEERGWCHEQGKAYHLTPPARFAQEWKGRQKTKLVHDLDQAFVLAGACWPDSGINVQDTLSNPNFKPHPALGPLLEWMSQRGGWPGTAQAASTARTLLRKWEGSQEGQPRAVQLSLLDGDE